MSISKKKLAIFIIYFCILLFILFFLFFLYKSYITNKYNDYDEIISFSNNIDSEVTFYNVNNNSVGIIYYNLSPSQNKVGENIVVRKYKNSDEISFEKFNEFLNAISNLTKTQYTISDNNIIKYGGEKVTISSEQLESLITIINNIK